MATKDSGFVHLHVHSEYSMLDGLCKLPELVAKAKSFGQKAIGLTDHGAMYGAIHFYNACQKEGIKPIIGAEVYVAARSRFDKQAKAGADQFHLTLLAQNYQGYQNLMKLVSLANLEGFSYRPRIDDELLAKYSEGIIVLSGCMQSRFNQLLLNNEKEKAIKLFEKYKTIFSDRFYVEIQTHPAIKELEPLTKMQVEVARDLNLPLVATNDVHYIEPQAARAQDALVCVQTRKMIDDENRMSMLDSPDFYLRSSQEMAELFHNYPDAIKNTRKIADQCQLEIPTGQLIFPNYPISKNKTESELLTEITFEGARQRLGKLTQEVEERLKYELKIINDKGYATYFLITQDFVNWAKQKGIAVGPGRGSVAGSLVSYALQITDINPLEHGLAFERFLNPERPTPPDIDLDFADNKRDAVIKYVADKYGHDRVGNVITFGRMEARAAVRDIGRVLGMPYEEPDKIAKLIPNPPGKKVSIESAIQSVAELGQYYKQPKYQKLLDLAKQVEGNIRHSSVHAAAVVITDKPLTDYTPVEQDTKSGKTITQYDMYALDCNVNDNAIGLLKFDFLGLRNLTIIQTALKLIKESKKKTIKISDIPIDNKKTYQLLARGDTMGVFQLESAGMKRVARSLKPNQFSDITAMVALYRPGPMDLIPTFIEGKHKPDSVTYPHETLKSVLQETYGVMVYQEQIMEIANIMAGYSLGEADILRRAIGKKKKKLLDQNKKRFIEQAVKKGYPKAVASKVWGFIEAFANYGFNKAHAASYAMIAYQTAYLKANYPVEYMTALMSVESSSHASNRDEKIAIAVENCKNLGILVLPPEINASDDDFSIEKYKNSHQGLAIRFGLNAIKHVGSAAIENILATRKEVGSFQSLTEFIYKTDGRKVNKTTLESLIKVGAFDKFGTRASMLENLESIRQTATQLDSPIEGQDGLFTNVKEAQLSMQDTFPKQTEYPQQELLSFEKELLGLYLTDHPLARSLKTVGKRANKKIGDLDAHIHTGSTFTFGGILSQTRSVQTKNGNKQMAFAKLEDDTGSINLVIFPKTWSKYKSSIQDDRVLIVKGKVDTREEELQVIVDSLRLPENGESDHAGSDLHHEIFIPRKTKKETLNQLGKLLKSHPGDDSAVIIIPNGAKPERLILPYGIAWSKELEQAVGKLLK